MKIWLLSAGVKNSIIDQVPGIKDDMSYPGIPVKIAGSGPIYKNYKKKSRPVVKNYSDEGSPKASTIILMMYT